MTAKKPAAFVPVKWRCLNCAYEYYPRKVAVCPKCKSERLEKVKA